VIASNAGAYAEPIAEHAVAMALALAKHLPQRHAGLARGAFDQFIPNRRIAGSAVGVVGYGGIGKATARLFRAFGARILAINSSGRTDDPVEFCGTLDDLHHVLGASDIVVLSIPLTARTRGLIGAAELAAMRRDAILVNVARGAIVDEGALYEHLRSTHEFSAAIDTWWDEPSGGAFHVDEPFFELPNLLGSPHNSGIVPGIEVVATRRAAENIARFLRGERVHGVVDPADYAGVR
jgi:glycerate dehydrogenase